METYSLFTFDRDDAVTAEHDPITTTAPPHTTPIITTTDVYEHIDECLHPQEAIDELNFYCKNCGVSIEPGFASASSSSGLAQGFFCHSYVNSINDRFSRFPKQKIKTVRTVKAVKTKEEKKEEEIPLSDLIRIQRTEMETKFENPAIPFIEKVVKIERGKRAAIQKDVDLVKHIVSECFSADKASFSHLVNGYAIYNTGKRKLAEPCPLSKFVPDTRSALVSNWDSFLRKVEFLYKEYSDMLAALNPLNKRNRSKAHIELYVILLVYHILQFHVDTNGEDGSREINVCTLNDCFDLNRITVTKIRPSNPKSKVKTVICGIADRLGVGNSSLPRLIIESINFSLCLLKNPRFAEYQKMEYV